MANEGMKFDSEKLRYDLLSPEAIEGLVKIITFGATKYGDRNWENGIKFSRVFGALQRHGWTWWDKKDLDEETKLNHLYHLLCNAMFLVHFISNPEKYKEFDDRPD